MIKDNHYMSGSRNKSLIALTGKNKGMHIRKIAGAAGIVSKARVTGNEYNMP